MSRKETGWWTITEDNIMEGKAVNKCGPRECTLTSGQIVKDGDARFFKIYDDDRVHYYSGYCILPDGLTDEAFRPLDDFGTPNAGATEIRYRSATGVMETL